MHVQSSSHSRGVVGGWSPVMGVAVVNYDITSNEGEGLELTRPVSKNDDERLEQ